MQTRNLRSLRAGALATLAVTALATLPLGACGAAAAGTKQPTPAFATATINNDSPSTVTAYLVRSDGLRYRLGTVSGLSQQDFPVRSDMVGATGEVRLVINVFGTDRLYVSDPAYLEQGDTVEFTVSHIVR